mmetsp:Transcript_9231/g.20942  ORF Transcript_9231/g.20942 Transcript_9231/m.20942 type:complete len:349 (-) Transcript_9231:74-1120(-)
MTTMLSISNGSSSSTTRRSSSPLRQLSSGTNSSSNNNASLQLHCRLGQHLRRLQSGELRRSWHLHHLRRRRSLALVVVILRARVVERVGWGSSRLSFHLTTTSSSSSSNNLLINRLGDTKAASGSYDWTDARRESSKKYTLKPSTINTTDTTTKQWYGVDALWQSSERLLMARGDVTRSLLSPAWRMMLLSDGSVTRHLQLLTDMKTEADCFEMKHIGDEDTFPALPAAVAAVPGPRLQRQVWLNDQVGTPLVYACSWWNAETVDSYLANSSLPIWVSLQKKGVDIHRQIESLEFGNCAELEAGFGHAGPFWARHYTFYHDGEPLTVIYEVFSPELDRYLGPNLCRDL